MICERCEAEFDGSRCACGWQVPALKVGHPADAWHTRLCQGCKNVRIRERVGHRGHDLCKWCNGDAAKEREEAMRYGYAAE